jgi:hypothetical protein
MEAAFFVFKSLRARNRRRALHPDPRVVVRGIQRRRLGCCRGCVRDINGESEHKCLLSQRVPYCRPFGKKWMIVRYRFIETEMNRKTVPDRD